MSRRYIIDNYNINTELKSSANISQKKEPNLIFNLSEIKTGNDTETQTLIRAPSLTREPSLVSGGDPGKPSDFFIWIAILIILICIYHLIKFCSHNGRNMKNNKNFQAVDYDLVYINNRSLYR
jgi:hypothetical protein